MKTQALTLAPAERTRIRRMMVAADELNRRTESRVRVARGKHRQRLIRHTFRLYAFSRSCMKALHPEEFAGFAS